MSTESTNLPLDLKHEEANININRINIENCKDFKHAVDCLALNKDLHESDDVILATLYFDDGFDDFTLSEINELGYLYRNKSIVVYCVSDKLNKFVIYWKSKELSYFLKTRHHEDTMLESDAELYEFVAEFLVKELGCGYLGISSTFKISEEANQFEIICFSDSRHYNLLLLACEAGRVNLAIRLYKYGLNADVPGQNLNIQDIALQNGHFQLIQALYGEDVPLPVPRSVKEYPGYFTEFIVQLEEFFNMIKADNIEKLEIIYFKLPKTRHFYNFSNESALKVAVKSSSFKCYEFLINHRHTFAPNEDPEELYEELEYEDQRTLREIHNKYTQELPDKHINVLMTKSFITHDVADAEHKLKIVRKAYRALNANGIIRMVLMVVAASKNFKIIFDFNRDSVNVADPTATSNTQGLFYTSGRIYIGAKQLLNEATSCETLAIIAHELCHYAMNLVYGNNAKPYKANDNKAIQEFEDISAHCAAIIDKEEVVNAVYEYYPPDMYHAELIVRVVHLLAIYSKNPEKLTEVRGIFGCLFNFFEKTIMPDMKDALPEIEGRTEKEILIKDRKISKFKKISLITGILAILGLIGTVFVGIILHKRVYKFNELSTTEKITVMNSSVVYKNVDIKFKDLFSDGSVAYEKLTSDHIEQALEGSKLNFEDTYLHYLNELVVLDWGNLTEKLKDKFLNSNFTFQNESVRFIDLHVQGSKCFNVLTSQNIIDVLNGNKLIVDKMIENRTKFYVERFFWNEDDILYIYNEYRNGNRDWLNETKFREYFDQFVGQDISGYVQKMADIKNKSNNQILSYFVSSADNSLDTLLNFTSFHDNFDKILNMTETSKIFILSSEDGTGKTINFEQFAIRIKKKYPTKWVSYINLKEYSNLYLENGTVNDVESLLTKIFNLTQFDQTIFHELYKSGSVVLLWNTFDEISPTYSKFILNTLVSIQRDTSNVQFVCTRPLYIEQLVMSLQVHPYSLVPFNEDQQVEFLTKFFKSINIEDSQINNFVFKTLNIVKSSKLNITIRYHDDEDLNTPLMLGMIADLISTNDYIYKSENRYDIYLGFVHKKIEIWQKKSKVAAKFSVDAFIKYRNFDMVEMYQMFAIKSDLRLINPLTQMIAGKLKIMRKKVPKELNNIEISQMEILDINGEFLHKTFAEFFVAQFLVENIFDFVNVDVDDAVVVFHYFQYLTEFYYIDQVKTTNFMISYLESQAGVNNHGLDSNMVDILKRKFSRIFFSILRAKQVEAFKFLFLFFKKDHKLLTDLLEIDENETLYTASYNWAYLPEGIDNFNRSVIKSLGEKYLTADEYEKFVNGRNQKGIILYGLYAINKQSVSRDAS
ncbi:uncharacterized protein [Chironomus tepperi]|uniref:uncharacterized protein isoform X2 n=1 Tax=Chironomus tepperi TaxID=113505 RepID=UPI00391F8E10